MIKIALVEDEAEFSNSLSSFIERFAKENSLAFEVNKFDNGLSFLEAFSCDYQIIFMDIDMPHLSGMETAERIRKLDQQTIIIFVTNLAQFAVKGYSVSALDYLLKPVNYEQFKLAFDRALKSTNKPKKQTLILDTAEGSKRILIEEIQYIEVQNHWVSFHMANGDVDTVRDTISHAETLLEGQGFSRTSNSFLVNLNFVSKVTSNDVYINDAPIPLSRSKKKEFMEDFASYMGGQL